MDQYKAAFAAAVKRLRKKLQDLGMTVDFYPEKPMLLKVSGGEQIGFEVQEFSISLVMTKWGEIDVSFDGAVMIPYKLLSTLKTGFMDIAANYMMMQHWLAGTARQKETE
jgi:hypothetical protein